VNLASGSRLKTRLKTRLNTFSRHLPLAVQPLHHRLSPSSAPRVPCKPASPELAAASRPSFLPPEAFDRPPSELTFRSSRLFLGKPLAVCITPVVWYGMCWNKYRNRQRRLVLLVVVGSACHVRRARDLRETRICSNTTLE
jgi:hypothetical protein